MKPPKTTAGEFLAQLQVAPQYQNKRHERDARLREIDERCAKDEASILKEVQRAGYAIESVYDFVNTSREYPEVLPILIRHLDVPHDSKIR